MIRARSTRECAAPHDAEAQEREEQPTEEERRTQQQRGEQRTGGGPAALTLVLSPIARSPPSTGAVSENSSFARATTGSRPARQPDTRHSSLACCSSRCCCSCNPFTSHKHTTDNGACFIDDRTSVARAAEGYGLAELGIEGGARGEARRGSASERGTRRRCRGRSCRRGRCCSSCRREQSSWW